MVTVPFPPPGSAGLPVTIPYVGPVLLPSVQTALGPLLVDAVGPDARLSTRWPTSPKRCRPPCRARTPRLRCRRAPRT